MASRPDGESRRGLEVGRGEGIADQSGARSLLVVAPEGVWSRAVLRAAAPLRLTARHVCSLAEAWEVCERLGPAFPDLAAIECRLADGCGVELARGLAAGGAAAEVLVVSDRVSLAEEVALAAAGILLFSRRRPRGELRAVLELLLERHAARAGVMLAAAEDVAVCAAVDAGECARCEARSLGAFCLDAARQRAVGPTAVVRLLEVLVEAAGAPVAWGRLASAVLERSDSSVQNALRVAVHRLRKALRAAGIGEPQRVIVVGGGMVWLVHARAVWAAGRAASGRSGTHLRVVPGGGCPRRARLAGEAPRVP